MNGVARVDLSLIRGYITIDANFLAVILAYFEWSYAIQGQR